MERNLLIYFLSSCKLDAKVGYTVVLVHCSREAEQLKVCRRQSNIPPER